jgi:oligosaccharide repeat unit polymerase
MTLFGWYFVTYSVIIASFWYNFKKNGKFWLVSIPATFMFIYVIFNVIGAPSLIDIDNDAHIKYIVALNLAIIIHTITYRLVDYVFHFNFKNDFNNFIHQPVSWDHNNCSVKFVFLLLLLTTFIISIIYLYKLNTIPLIELIRNPGVGTVLAKSREVATTTFEGKYHRYSFFFKILLPLLSLISISASYKNKDLFWRIISVLTLGFALFMLIADLQKAPIIFFLISVFLLFSILRKNIDIKKIILICIIFFIVIILMYLFIMGLVGRNMIEIVNTIGIRLFLSQTKGMLTAFEVFPQEHEFLYGVSFPNPGHIFNYEQFSLPKYLFVKTYGVHRLVVGTAPTTYFTEFYVNFGFIGMIASMFIGAFLLQVTQILIIRLSKNMISMGLLAFFALFLAKIALTSLFISYGIMFMILLLIIYSLIISINTIINILKVS